jgi:hypothetical protein
MSDGRNVQYLNVRTLRRKRRTERCAVWRSKLQREQRTVQANGPNCSHYWYGSAGSHQPSTSMDDGYFSPTVMVALFAPAPPSMRTNFEGEIT